MLLLVFYRPQGSMKALRSFEFFVMLLVLAVVVCFCIELAHIENTTVGQVFKGYLPNNAVVQGEGLYQACGILGATVMPHSLYLGSGLPQRRLLDYDEHNDLLPADSPASAANSLDDDKKGDKIFYAPSLRAVKHCLKYSYVELAISLFTFALFVNSAILIVAGASLYGNTDALDADIFGIHSLLKTNLGTGAATVFALALLFSGVSAGIVCTISGQMVCEGAMQWRMKPWLRRLLTRSLSITPSIIIAGATGRDRLSAALNGSQVALSVVLPFVSAPLIYYTCLDRFMTVRAGPSGGARFYREGDDKGSTSDEDADAGGPENVVTMTATNTSRPTRRSVGRVVRSRSVDIGAETDDDETRVERGSRAPGAVEKMSNDWWVCVLSVLVWLIITIMNVANLVLLGLGN
jgi:metal iron transporter